MEVRGHYHTMAALPSLMRFLSSNLEIYTFNTSVHNINTRRKLKLHKPAARLTMCQRSAYYNSTNIYNKLPDLAELVSNKKCFLLQLKIYLTDKPFYSVEEYFECIIDLWWVAQCGNVHINVILVFRLCNSWNYVSMCTFNILILIFYHLYVYMFWFVYAW